MFNIFICIFITLCSNIYFFCPLQVQVIQQPIQNPTYLQQLYNTQGQLLMPSNIALHPSINPQQIQVIFKPNDLKIFFYLCIVLIINR